MAKSLLLFFLIAVLSPLQAQVVSFQGQVRHRSEYDDKGITEAGEGYLFHLLRTRLGATARPSEHVSALIQVQDSRMFGGEDPSQGQGTLDASADQLDLHQAFLNVSIPGADGLSARVGRQELSYGNQRIIGKVDWANTGRSFDGALARLEHSRGSVDLFGAQLVAPNQMPGSQNVFGFYSTSTMNEDHAVDLFALYDNDTNEVEGGPDAGSDRVSRFTPGIRAYGSPDAFDYALEGIYQGGNIQTIPGDPRASVSAYLLAAEAGYKAGASRFGVGYTRLSGDDNPADNESQTFNLLFASNHAFYGFMDYFPRFSGPAGLQDINLSVTSSIGRGLRIQLDGHHFAAATSTAGVSSTFGQEIDLVLSFNGADMPERALAGFQLAAGASMFLPGDRFEPILGDDPTWWLFLTTSVGF